jgi:hypothetical protein
MLASLANTVTMNSNASSAPVCACHRGPQPRSDGTCGEIGNDFNNRTTAGFILESRRSIPSRRTGWRSATKPRKTWNRRRAMTHRTKFFSTCDQRRTQASAGCLRAGRTGARDDRTANTREQEFAPPRELPSDCVSVFTDGMQPAVPSDFRGTRSPRFTFTAVPYFGAEVSDPRYLSVARANEGYGSYGRSSRTA